jgi:hypothetical protein
MPLAGKNQASREREGEAIIKTMITALVGVVLALGAAGSSYSETAAGPAKRLQPAQLSKKDKAPGTQRESWQK